MDQLHLRPVVQVSAERAQYIIDTPARYTQEVFFGLQHNSHGILLELHSFMCEHHELHTNLMYIFIEQGIMHGLVHFALHNGFRYMEDANDLEVSIIPASPLSISHSEDIFRSLISYSL